MPVTVITGASRGIGKAIALALARQGHELALLARDPTTLARIAAEIAPTPLLYPVDVRDKQAVQSAFQDIYGKKGRIDVLVNSAGILLQGTHPLPDLLETNLLGAFHCITAVLEPMKAQKKGHIFNIVSKAGKVGIGSLSGYCASKFALMGLNDSLFVELAQYGVHITALCPGLVNTDMTRNAKIPAEEQIPAADIVLAIEFLLRLSPQTRIRELVLECGKTVELSNNAPFFPT